MIPDVYFYVCGSDLLQELLQPQSMRIIFSDDSEDVLYVNILPQDKLVVTAGHSLGSEALTAVSMQRSPPPPQRLCVTIPV